MLKNLLGRIVGDPNQRELSRLQPVVDQINSLEPEFQAKSNAELRALTDQFKRQIAGATRRARERVTDQRKMIASEPEAQRRRKLEAELKELEDEQTKAEKDALGEVLPWAFATVREVAKRTLYMRPFDVQLIGGIVLHEGKIAEMRTGEGKTLVATLPVYLNALLGYGVHLVTVNDYLARRDAVWMGRLYDFLGLTVGVLQGADMKGEMQTFIYQRGYGDGPYPDLRPVRTRKRRVLVRKGNSLVETQQTVPDRREAYEADITYGTNNEFGFDYLRDNLAYTLEDRVQRELYYAIIDEVDNILIDEARTPLIISGQSDEPIEEYRHFAQMAVKLKPDVDYTVDEKDRYAVLTDAGLAKAEEELGISNIYDDANVQYVHYLEQSVTAKALFLRDRDYIVKGGRVILIDQHTGRLMPDRRLSDGLHQAIEAKEGVRDIRPQMMTHATVTIQNFYRMYRRLAGMTGTAKSEEEELYGIYGLGVVAIPTNVEYMVEHPDPKAEGPRLVTVRERENGTEVVTYCREGDPQYPVFYRRTDFSDVVYSTEEAKWRAIVSEIIRMHCAGRPVLVGTTSVEKSEKLASRLELSMLSTLGRVSLLQDGLREAGTPIRGQYEELLAPLDTVSARTCNAIARELGWSDSDPASASNVRRLAALWGVDDVEALARVLRDGIRYQRWVRDDRRHIGNMMLDEEVSFSVLNAKEHEREAEIIADAGVTGAVTIATSMAGRGVDIQLGGELPDVIRRAAYERLEARGLNPFQVSPSQFFAVVAEVAPQYVRMRERVLEVGGLHVLGTERHEARRIDNQLRGRAGRQGEPGSSRFYISLEDDLMRIFGGDRVKGFMEWAKVDPDMPLEHNMLSKVIEQSQERVEGHNFDIRKHVLEYDDVLNRQREMIYDQRLRVLTKEDLHDDLWTMVEAEITDRLEREFGDGKQRGASQSPRRRELSLFSYLDSILPLVPVSMHSPYGIKIAGKGPRQAASHSFRLPPFSVMFLAEQVQGMPAEALPEMLFELGGRGLEAYHDELLERLIEAPLEEWVDGRDGHLEAQSEQLEGKINEFLAWIEEQHEMRGGRPSGPGSPLVTVGELAKHLQHVYPLFRESRLPALRGKRARRGDRHEYDDEPVTSSQVVLRKLRDDLEVVYDRRVVAYLLDQVDKGVPHRLQVKWASTLDVADKLQPLAERALALLDDPPRGEREIERLATDLEARKPALDGQSSLDSLRLLNKWACLDVYDVAEVVQAAFEFSYSQWAETQRASLSKAVRDAAADIETISVPVVIQLLLDVYYTPAQTPGRSGRREMDFPLGFLPPYQAHALAGEMRPAERREAILSIIEQAIQLRQQMWGEEELSRQGHKVLSELGPDERQALVRYWARELTVRFGEERSAGWPPDVRETWERWARLRQFEEQPLGQLEDFDAIAAHLAPTWQAELAGWEDLDAETQARIEAQVTDWGAFTDRQSERRFFEQRLGDLKKERRALISWLGRDYLEGVRMQPVGELPPEVRVVVRDCLKQRGAFTDQARKQQFFVHERLAVLGEGMALAACRALTRNRLERQRDLQIAEKVSPDVKQAVEWALVESGYLTDLARQQATIRQPLSGLEPAALEALSDWLGQTRLCDRRRDNQLHQEIVTYLKGVGYFVDQARVEAVRQQPVASLALEVRELVRETVLAYVKAIMHDRPISEMPDWLQEAIYAHLDRNDYFVDAQKAEQWLSKALFRLPDSTKAELTELLGARIAQSIAGRPVGELEPETQSAILGYLGDRQLYRRRAERQSLLEGQLDDLGRALRDDVVAFLAREELSNLSRLPAINLSGELGEAVRLVIKRSDIVADHEKKEILPLLELADLEARVRQELEAHLSQLFDDWLRTRPVGELPPDWQEWVDQALDRSEYLLDRGAVTSFTVIQLDESSQVYAGLARHIGRHVVDHLDNRPLDELEADVRDWIWQGLEAIGYFRDEDKQRKLLAGSLANLERKVPEAYQLVEESLAQRLYQDVADRPVADLADHQRRELSEYLEEETDYFQDEQALADFDSQRPAGLKPGEYEAVAQAIGELLVKPYQDMKMGDWPADAWHPYDLRGRLEVWWGEQGKVENEALLEQFRQAGLAALGESQRERGHEWWFEQQKIALRDKCLLELDDNLRLLVEEFLESRIALSAVEALPGRIDRDEMLRFAGYWARRQLAVLDNQRIGGLARDERRSVRDFYGWYRWHHHVKNTLLSHISHLWIGYLTRIENLRQGIGLEAFGQRDPLVEYKRRAFDMFNELLLDIRRGVMATAFR